MKPIKYININTKSNMFNFKEKDIFISNKLSKNYQKNPYDKYIENNKILLNNNNINLKEFFTNILKEIIEIILFINAYLYIVYQINNKLHNINLNKFNLSSKAELIADNIYSIKIFNFLIKEIYIKTNDNYYFKIYPNLDIRINSLINDIYIRLYDIYPIKNLFIFKEYNCNIDKNNNKNFLFNIYLYKILKYNKQKRIKYINTNKFSYLDIYNNIIKEKILISNYTNNK